MDMVTQQNLVTAITRALVPKLAPYEIMMFDQQHDVYLRDPEHVLRQALGQETEGMIFLTPILRAVLTDVINYICAEIKRTLTISTPYTLNLAVRQMFRNFLAYDESETPQRIQISEQQCRAIRQLALEKARAQKLSELKSQQLADMVVRCLMTQH
ncbi:MAG: hypothetical protein KC443_05515 [Anaerolineales bacterium]|nr:hypothetical protein [Anaerolineales bacterium]MCB8968857.1 hypothetical protein [Ardenticatenaceae bacterium]